MTEQLPTQLNIADWFLDSRVREGRGDRTALITDSRRFTYREVQALANRYAYVLGSAGVAPEQRVIIALPDGPIQIVTHVRWSRAKAVAGPPEKPAGAGLEFRAPRPEEMAALRVQMEIGLDRYRLR